MELKLFDLGLVDFQSSWDLQKRVLVKIREKDLFSALILCRHKPVITLGRTSREKDILVNKENLKKLNIKIYEIERGGGVTYHGPGQLCIYPIINLSRFKKDIRWFLRTMESVLLKLLSEFEIAAQTIRGATGIWITPMPTDAGEKVKKKKIASIGIAIRNWITFHGISLNVKKDDLTNFSLIRPCGSDIIMTSMEDITGEEVIISKVKEVLIEKIKIILSL